MTTKVNRMDSWNYGFEAHDLSAEGAANNPQASAPAEVTVIGDPPLKPGAWISQLGQASAIAAPALAIQGCWHALSQGLVGPLLIVAGDPARGAPLPATRRGRRWRGQLGFIDAMHLFVRAVVLRPGTACKNSTAIPGRNHQAESRDKSSAPSPAKGAP